MDLTLLFVAVGFIVAGFLVGLVGLWVDSQSARRAEGAKVSLWDLVVKAIRELFTAIRKLTRGPAGDRIQALGSALAYVGLVVFLVWVGQALNLIK